MYKRTSPSSPPQQKLTNQSGLTRYGSDPGAFLTQAVDSMIEASRGGTTTTTTITTNPNTNHDNQHGVYWNKNNEVGQYLGASSGRTESTPRVNSSNGGGSNLIRQNSSPPGFLTTLVSDHNNQGFSITRGSGSAYNKKSNREFHTGFSTFEGEYSLPLLSIPEDSVPCKVRAKRGFATHPRSIAERERRTRISAKLKKLQVIVPNMDKQTSYSDMLELAVQHIKGLQSQVQKLEKDLENCTCGRKPNK